jgi:hypothetical protein
MAKLVKTAMDAPLTLEDMQRIMGLINDFGQMCPFMTVFGSAYTNSARFSEHKVEARLLPHQAAQELRVWALAAYTAADGLPTPHRQLIPYLAALCFVSDAAGASFAKGEGRFIQFGDKNDSNAASISAMEDGPV